MKKLFIILSFLIAFTAGAQVFSPRATGVFTATSLPGTCSTGSLRVKIADSLLYVCGPDNTWTAAGGISQATADGLYIRQDGTSPAMTNNLNLGAVGLIFTGSNRALYSNGIGPRWFDATASAQWGFDLSGLTTNRTVVVPDAAGTLALTSSNVATATALAANPADCSVAGQFALAIAANGDLTCGTPAGGSPPFTDDVTQALVKGTADATKLFGVNLAGLTTGNHPVLTITGTTAAPVWSFPGNLTSPGAGAASEHFGALSAASGNNSVSLGNSALASGLESVAIGSASPATTASGSTTVVIGGRASATNNGGTSLGWNAITSSNGDIALGSGARAAGGIAMGTNSIANGIPSLAIGNASTTGSFTSVVIGRAATATASGQVVFGGNDGSFSYLTDFYGGNGVAVAVPQPVTWHSPAGTGSNVGGANLSIAPGVGTGNTAGGDPILKTSPPGASGSTAGTLVSRLIPRAKPISLTSGAAANVIDIPLPTLAMTGGSVIWTIICTDGTDMQTVAGTITYSAVNKGGSYTKDIETVSSATPSDAITPVIGWAKSLSTGTLTTAWAVTTGTNKITLQVTSTTSLTATKFLLYYTINNNSEQDLTPL